MIENILRFLGLLMIVANVAIVIHAQANWDGEIPEDDDLRPKFPRELPDYWYDDENED